MKACEAKIGEKYLSRTGIPVVMMGTTADKKITLKLVPTGSTIRVNGDYELKPYAEKGISKMSQALMRGNGKGKKADKAKTKGGSSLAAIIDPMLLAGGHTVNEIAAELAKKASDAGKGKDLNANVRARMVTYTRKGWKVVKDDKKRVKVVQNNG